MIKKNKDYMQAIRDIKDVLNNLGGAGADPETWAAGWDNAITSVEMEVDKLGTIVDIRTKEKKDEI